MEEDEAADPVDVGLFSAERVVFDAQSGTDAVEQLRRVVVHC